MPIVLDILLSFCEDATLQSADSIIQFGVVNSTCIFDGGVTIVHSNYSNIGVLLGEHNHI